MRIARLPWYDFDELAPATDALWLGIARHAERAGIPDVPHRLDRATDHAVQWKQPELLLSQACGYDVLYDNAPDLLVVATPRYAIPGCEGGTYRSAVVVRESDRLDDLESLRGRTCVVNERSSH